MPSLTRRSRLDGREIGQSPTSRWELGHLNLLVVLAGGSVTLWLLSKTTIFDWIMKRFMQWAVNRWMQITVSDYAELLILSGDFVVTDLEIEDQEMRSQERREAEYPIAAREHAQDDD